jgi:hypothetical protein
MRSGPSWNEVADKNRSEPFAIRAPGPLREAVGDVKRRAARHQQHAQRDQERRDLQRGHEPPVDHADQGGDGQAIDEGHEERGAAAVEQRPHQHRRQAEKRADREVELARVISSVMASAINPSSTVKASVFEMLSTDRKAGLIAVKTTISARPAGSRGRIRAGRTAFDKGLG